MYQLILASNSPRRRELLAGLDVPFEVKVLQGIDESYPADTPVGEVPVFIAKAKAEAYRGRINDDQLVITADTVVVLDNLVLGKPASHDDACDMLRALSGKTHQVITGVTLRCKDGSRSFYEKTDVTFATLSDKDIDYYISHYRPFDKAGAYGIQEWIGMVGVEKIDGCFYNVMGLPVHRLYKEICCLFCED